MKLSVIIPVYNEEKRIGPTFKSVLKYLSKQSYSWEIIFVNDGSVDGTVQLIRDLIGKNKKIYIIDNRTNKGKGAVVRQGMLAAKGKWRIFMDADNSTKINEIEKFWPFTKNFEVLFGSRYLPESNIIVKQPISRRIFSRVGNLLTRFFLSSIKDTQCGFKMFSKRLSKKVFSVINKTSWSFDFEIILACKVNDIKIKEVPVIWEEGRGSKLKLFKTAFRTFRDLFSIVINKEKYRF